MSPDTRPKCGECNGRGVDGWGGTCLRCGGQGREPFREWGKEDDEDNPNEDPSGQRREPMKPDPRDDEKPL